MSRRLEDPPDQDLSESDVCGNCPLPSVDDEGEPVCQEAPGFCSKVCQDQYMVCMGEQAAAEHAQLQYEQHLAEEGLPLVEECVGPCKHAKIYLIGGYRREDGLLMIDVGCDDCGINGSTTIDHEEVLW